MLKDNPIEILFSLLINGFIMCQRISSFIILRDDLQKGWFPIVTVTHNDNDTSI